MLPIELCDPVLQFLRNFVFQHFHSFAALPIDLNFGLFPCHVLKSFVILLPRWLKLYNQNIWRPSCSLELNLVVPYFIFSWLVFSSVLQFFWPVFRILVFPTFKELDFLGWLSPFFYFCSKLSSILFQNSSLSEICIAFTSSENSFHSHSWQFGEKTTFFFVSGKQEGKYSSF